MIVDNELTIKKLLKLRQGSKVEFKWWGNKKTLYTGRIEVDKYGEKYFVNEDNYDGETLRIEGMRYYNTLESFGKYTYFKILQE